MSDVQNDDIREQARKRLKNKSDFRTFLWVWLFVSVLTTAIWALTNLGGYFWPGWAIGGMGIAAFFQALSIWGPGRGAITESDVDDEVRRMTRKP